MSNSQITDKADEQELLTAAMREMTAQEPMTAAQIEAELTPFRCRCGKNAFATEAEADAFNEARTVVTHPNGSTTSFATKCADCGTFATDHEFNGGYDSDFRCYFDDIRSGSHR
jgi:hypothetical protein